MLDYHCGLKMRPDLAKFSKGIIKTEEAINFAIGDENSGRGRRMRQLELLKEQNKPQNTAHVYEESSSSDEAQKEHRRMKRKISLAAATARSPPKIDPDRSLLEGLHDDKLFLQMLQSQRVMINADSGAVGTLIADALEFLSNRAAFWKSRRSCTPCPRYCVSTYIFLVDRCLPRWGVFRDLNLLE